MAKNRSQKNSVVTQAISFIYLFPFLDAYVILENMNALKNSKYSKLPNAARSYMKTNNLYNSDYITHSESDIHKKGYYNARMLARINNEKRNQIAKGKILLRKTIRRHTKFGFSTPCKFTYQSNGNCHTNTNTNLILIPI